MYSYSKVKVKHKNANLAWNVRLFNRLFRHSHFTPFYRRGSMSVPQEMHFYWITFLSKHWLPVFIQTALILGVNAYKLWIEIASGESCNFRTMQETCNIPLWKWIARNYLKIQCQHAVSSSLCCKNATAAINKMIPQYFKPRKSFTIVLCPFQISN